MADPILKSSLPEKDSNNQVSSVYFNDKEYPEYTVENLNPEIKEIKIYSSINKDNDSKDKRSERLILINHRMIK